MNIHLKPKMMRVIRRQGVKNEHDVEAIADDVLMSPTAVGYENRRAKQAAIDFLRKVTFEADFSLDATIDSDEGESATRYETQAYDDCNERRAALHSDQRRLIDGLVSGSDERTMLIVQTFLQNDKPTVTSVANQLGLHHEVVKRALLRLRRNYSESKCGEYTDYFTA